MRSFKKSPKAMFSSLFLLLCVCLLIFVPNWKKMSFFLQKWLLLLCLLTGIELIMMVSPSEVIMESIWPQRSEALERRDPVFVGS